MMATREATHFQAATSSDAGRRYGCQKLDCGEPGLQGIARNAPLDTCSRMRWPRLNWCTASQSSTGGTWCGFWRRQGRNAGCRDDGLDCEHILRPVGTHHHPRRHVDDRPSAGGDSLATHYLQPSIVPFRATAVRRSHTSTSTSTTVVRRERNSGAVIPALLCRMCSPPNV